MSTLRCEWICPVSYFFAAVLLAGAFFAVLFVDDRTPAAERAGELETLHGMLCGLSSASRRCGAKPYKRSSQLLLVVPCACPRRSGRSQT